MTFFLFLADLFLRNEVDMAMFTTLGNQDLLSIGVSSFGARKIMLNAIEGTSISDVLTIHRII